MEEPIMVSIICFTYNHEKYIKKALDSFVNQKSNFLYEIIIHDDASTDSTADVIREYEKKFPNLIKAIYQTENQYSKKIPIQKRYIVPLIRGKYVAICEGDDYLSSEDKIAKQVIALETNKNCYFSVHKVECVSEDGTLLNVTMPNFSLDTGVYNSKEFLALQRYTWPFQTSSYFMDADKYKEYINNLPEFAKVSPVGDEPLILYFGQLGDTYYINEALSRYRKAAINSWTSRQKKLERSVLLNYFERKIKSIDLFDNFTMNRYHEICECRKFYLLIEKNSYQNNSKEMRKAITLYKNNPFLKNNLKLTYKIKMYLKYYIPLITTIYNFVKSR